MAEVTIRKWKIELSSPTIVDGCEDCRWPCLYYGYIPVYSRDLHEELGVEFELFFLEEGPPMEGKVYKATLNITNSIMKDMVEEFGEDFVRSFYDYSFLPPDIRLYVMPGLDVFFSHLILSYIKETWSDWKERVLVRGDYRGGYAPPSYIFELSVYFKHESDRRRFLEGIRDYVYQRIRGGRYKEEAKRSKDFVRKLNEFFFG
jgi:hypothetical protein